MESTSAVIQTNGAAPEAASTRSVSIQLEGPFRGFEDTIRLRTRFANSIRRRSALYALESHNRPSKPETVFVRKDHISRALKELAANPDLLMEEVSLDYPGDKIVFLKREMNLICQAKKRFATLCRKRFAEFLSQSGPVLSVGEFFRQVLYDFACSGPHLRENRNRMEPING